MTANKAGSAADTATPNVKTLERELKESTQRAKNMPPTMNMLLVNSPSANPTS